MITHEGLLEVILEAMYNGIQNQEGDVNKHVAHEVLQKIITALNPYGKYRGDEYPQHYIKFLSYGREDVTGNL